MLSKRALKEVRSSHMILVIVVSHLVLSTPGNIIYIIHTAIPDYWTNVPGHEFIFCLAHIMYVLNYSANFLLYCLGNSNVRKEAFKFFFKGKNLYGTHHI